MKPLAILKDYFGFRAEEHRGIDEETGARFSGMKDFAEEVKKLSPEEKAELVEGAAAVMGVEVTP